MHLYSHEHRILHSTGTHQPRCSAVRVPSPPHAAIRELVLPIVQDHRWKHPIRDVVVVTRQHNVHYEGVLKGLGWNPEQIRARLDEIGRPFGMSLSDLSERPPE